MGRGSGCATHRRRQALPADVDWLTGPRPGRRRRGVGSGALPLGLTRRPACPPEPPAAGRPGVRWAGAGPRLPTGPQRAYQTSNRSMISRVLKCAIFAGCQQAIATRNRLNGTPFLPLWYWFSQQTRTGTPYEIPVQDQSKLWRIQPAIASTLSGRIRRLPQLLWLGSRSTTSLETRRLRPP